MRIKECIWIVWYWHLVYSEELVAIGYYHCRCILLFIYILCAFLQRNNRHRHYILLQAASPSPKSVEAAGLCIDHISPCSFSEECEVLTLIHSTVIHGSLLSHHSPHHHAPLRTQLNKETAGLKQSQAGLDLAASPKSRPGQFPPRSTRLISDLNGRPGNLGSGSEANTSCDPTG